MRLKVSSAKWRPFCLVPIVLNASVNYTLIGSDNCLSPVRSKPLSERIPANCCTLDPSGNNYQLNYNQNTAIFVQENAFENIVCKIPAIFFLLNVKQVLTIPRDTKWDWVDNHAASSAPHSAVIGGYSQEGRPVYVVRVRKLDASYIAGCYEDGKTTAKYVLNKCSVSVQWKYLVIVNGKLISWIHIGKRRSHWMWNICRYTTRDW